MVVIVDFAEELAHWIICSFQQNIRESILNKYLFVIKLTLGQVAICMHSNLINSVQELAFTSFEMTLDDTTTDNQFLIKWLHLEDLLNKLLFVMSFNEN